MKSGTKIRFSWYKHQGNKFVGKEVRIGRIKHANEYLVDVLVRDNPKMMNAWGEPETDHIVELYPNEYEVLR